MDEWPTASPRRAAAPLLAVGGRLGHGQARRVPRGPETEAEIVAEEEAAIDAAADSGDAVEGLLRSTAAVELHCHNVREVASRARSSSRRRTTRWRTGTCRSCPPEEHSTDSFSAFFLPYGLWTWCVCEEDEGGSWAKRTFGIGMKGHDGERICLCARWVTHGSPLFGERVSICPCHVKRARLHAARRPESRQGDFSAVSIVRAGVE